VARIIARMKYFWLMLVLPAVPALGAMPDSTLPLDAAHVPIPLSTGWVEGFLLMIVWLFVAAILVGPLVKFFHLEPRSDQVFIDDRRIRS